MAAKLFAAIDVGSYELTMKIYEIKKGSIEEIDCVRRRISLGSDSYNTGRIGNEKLNALCETLSDFARIMQGYKVDAYKAYGTSAIREIENTDVVLDQVKIRTGIDISVISNSEQRFLDYKALASKPAEFSRYIEGEGDSALLDIGGGSVQISLFENDTLVATQNMHLGVMIMRERLEALSAKSGTYERLIEESVNTQFSLFRKFYLKDADVKNLVLIDDYLSPVLGRREFFKTPGVIDRDEFFSFMTELSKMHVFDISRKYSLSEEHASLLFYSAVLTDRILEVFGSQKIWCPGVSLCEGIAFEYAQSVKLAGDAHDFEKDILASTLTISKRFMCSRKRNEFLEALSLTIFDKMKKLHGLSKRERLLLQIAVQLNDCGKYISQTEVGECSFRIIMATEIIGLSHREREIVAFIAKYNRDEFDYNRLMYGQERVGRDEYLTIAKLTAILRVANGLDRSHKQKFRDYKVMLKDNELIISVDTKEDITLEEGLLTERKDFFEEVYNVRPVIKQKRQ
ncbi:MAG TPA: exopolyphosphatase [Lachnospiraceae bacterium]|nr:exopolyphosphatase [Lachnospiraceae bacterium]